MDLASIIGLVVALILVIFGIVFDKSVGVNFGAMVNFVDIPSVLITFGGAFMCQLAANTMADFIGGLKSFALILKTPAIDTIQIIQKIIDLSNTARKEGLLSLEEAAADLDDAFLKKCMGLASTLHEIGIGEEHFTDMARGAVAAGLTRGYVPMDEAAAVALYQACL